MDLGKKVREFLSQPRITNQTFRVPGVGQGFNNVRPTPLQQAYRPQPIQPRQVVNAFKQQPTVRAIQQLPRLQTQVGQQLQRVNVPQLTQAPRLMGTGLPGVPVLPGVAVKPIANFVGTQLNQQTQSLGRSLERAGKGKFASKGNKMEDFGNALNLMPAIGGTSYAGKIAIGKLAAQEGKFGTAIRTISPALKGIGHEGFFEIPIIDRTTGKVVKRLNYKNLGDASKAMERLVVGDNQIAMGPREMTRQIDAITGLGSSDFSKGRKAVKVMTTRESKAIQDNISQRLNSIKQSSSTAQDLNLNINKLVDDVIKSSKGDKEVLSGLRTSLNKEISGLVGTPGDYKANYAALQTLKGDPELGPILQGLEDHIGSIDDLLTKPKSAFKIKPSVPEAGIADVAINKNTKPLKTIQEVKPAPQLKQTSSVASILDGDKKALGEAMTLQPGKMSPTVQTPEIPGNLSTPSQASIIPKVRQTFRIDKFDVGEEEQKLLEGLQKSLGFETRGVRTHKEVKALAEELGTEPKKLLRDIKNGRITDAEVTALGNTISTSSQRIIDLTKKMAKDPTNKNLKQELINEEALINKVISKRITGLTEAGRTVSAARIIANRNLEPTYWLDKAKRQIGNDKDLPSEVITAITDLIGKKDRLGLAYYISKLGESSGVEKATGLWKAMLLTGFRTHEANILSNVTMAGLETIKDIPATGIDIARATLTGGKRAKSFNPVSTVSQLEGMGEGVRRAKQVLTTGIDPKDLAKAEFQRQLRFGNTPGGKIAQKVTNAVFRTLGAEDKVFYETAFKRSMDEQFRLAKMNGGAVTEPTADMIAVATKDALYSTFTNENAMASAIKAAKQAGGPEFTAAVDVVIPFVRTPTNVAKAAFIDYTPVGGFKTLAQKIFRKESVTDKELADNLGRSITGTAVLWLGYELAKRGLVSGPSPTSEAERAQWELEGKTANSVYIGGEWRNVSRISPQGTLILLGAEAFKSDGDAAAIAGAGVKGFSENSFLKGLSGGLKAVNDPDRFASSFIENTISGYVPTLSADIAGGLDPVDKRNPEGLKEKIVNRVPVLREQLPAKLSPLGEPFPNNRGLVGKVFDPLNSSTPTSDPLVKEFSRVGYNLNYVGDTIDEQALNRAQKDEYQRLAGVYIRELVPQVVNSDGYSTLTKDQQRDIIEKAVNAAKSQAREEVRPKLANLQEDGGLFKVGAAGKEETPSVDKNLDMGGKGAKSYTYVSDGTVKTTTIDFDIKQPTLTGDAAFDKKLMSRYKSKITTEIGNVYDLYDAKQISLDEAKVMISKLEAKEAGKSLVKAKVGGRKGKKVKMARFPSSLPKATLKIKKSKALKVKLGKSTSTPKKVKVKGLDSYERDLKQIARSTGAKV